MLAPLGTLALAAACSMAPPAHAQRPPSSEPETLALTAFADRLGGSPLEGLEATAHLFQRGPKRPSPAPPAGQERLAGGYPWPTSQSEGLDSDLIAEGSLRPDGSVVFDLSGWLDLAPNRSGTTDFLVVLDGSGLCATQCAVRSLPAPDGTQEFGFIAKPGATLRGAVFDGEGRPTAAWVEWRAGDEAPAYFSSKGITANTRSFPDGRFELDLSAEILEAGEPLSIYADAGPRGTGAVISVPLATVLDPVQPVRLLVIGPGALRGRVLDAAGGPSPGLTIRAEAQGLNPDRPIAGARAGALTRATRTNSAGEFELEGLAADTFQVWTQPEGYRGTPVRLTRDPVPADGAPLELIYQRTALEVRSAAGPALRHQPYSFEPTTWPRRRTVLIYPAVGEHAHWHPGHLAPRRHGQLDNGVLHVPDNVPLEPLAVLLVGGAFETQTRLVDVREGHQIAQFPAPTQRLLGRTRFQLVCPENSLVHGNHRLRIEPIDFPFTAAVAGQPYPYVPETELELPAGRYRAILEGTAIIDSHHGSYMGPRTVGRTELEFEVVRGATLEYTIETTPGTLLEVSCSATINGERLEPEPGEVGDPGWPDPRDRAALDLEYTRRRERAVSLLLLHSTRAPEPLYFVRGSSLPGMSQSTTLRPETRVGLTQRAQMVPAGNYELIAELQDGRVIRRTLTLEERTLKRVRLDFDSEPGAPTSR